jgi:hypothetical protein
MFASAPPIDLVKFTVGSRRRKMQFALWSMTRKANGTRIVSGWQYATARAAKIAATAGVARPDVSDKLRGNKNGLGYKHTAEAKVAIGYAARNRSSETLAIISKQVSERGVSDVTRAKLRFAQLLLGDIHSFDLRGQQERPRPSAFRCVKRIDALTP